MRLNPKASSLSQVLCPFFYPPKAYQQISLTNLIELTAKFLAYGGPINYSNLASILNKKERREKTHGNLFFLPIFLPDSYFSTWEHLCQYSFSSHGHKIRSIRNFHSLMPSFPFSYKEYSDMG